MDDAQRRDMWASRTERCLSADTTIKEWCRLNKVSESNLYRWMARFREEEPGRFPRRSSEASNWIKVTAGREPAPADASADIGGEAAAALPIRALVGRVELAIPAGAAESDIAAATRAAASL